MHSTFRYLHELMTLMGKSKPVLVAVFAMGTLLGFMDLACIVLLAKIVAAVTQNASTVALVPASIAPPFGLFYVGIFLIAFYVVRALLGIAFHFTIYKRTNMIEADLRARLITRFMTMPYEQRLKRTTGDLLTAVNQWTSRFSNTVLTPLLRFCCDATVGMLILAYFMVLYPITVLIFLVSALILGFLYDRTLRRIATENARVYRALSEEISESSQQALAGYKEIRVLGLTGFFRNHIHRRSTTMGHALAISNTIGQSPRLIIEAMLVIIGITILLYFSHSGIDITHQLPQFAMLTFVVLRVSSLVSLATATAANLRLYRGVIGQLAADFQPDAMDNASTAPLPAPADFISLAASNLVFHYEGSTTPILHNLSFAIREGEALAIVGESGAGKTTLVDLLLGILNPTSGNIAITLSRDGVTEQQSNFIGVASYLSQNTFIINDTLRRNVALGEADADIDDARVIAALQKARLPQHAHVAQLDTMMGDRGARLSGGQRQRVALARAFYHGHKVMILDEATNAIDLATEIEIVQDLLALRPEITLITITHRPEIAKLFPRTLHLKAGTAV